MTNYGENIVLANSAYTDVISDTRIWVDQRIIRLLDARLRCYGDMAKNFEKSKETATIPDWYSDTITGYWDIAGLPHTVSGAFFSLSTPGTGQIPAVLTFVKDETGQEYFGWYFSIGEFTIKENTNFSLFLDPRKSAATIYSRNGKTPSERTVRLDCTLYASPNITTAIERNIIEQCITPFIRADREGIDVRIIFDGNTFEIREHPAAHGNTLIFQGQSVGYGT
jgi:hypothetical protein